MTTNDNPLLRAWDTPFGVPPFETIEPGHFLPAIEAACAENLAEIAAIRDDPAEPDFENTIAAQERAGRALDRVTGVFYNLTGAHTNEALQAVERALSPLLARHFNSIYLDPVLFRRVDAVAARAGELGLDAEQARVLENYHRSFRRQGAGLPEAERTRLAEIGERLATLGTRFGQNVLADEQSFALPLDCEADLAGLPDYLRAAMRQAAEERGLSGHVVTLARSLIEPFLQYSTRRDLRERAFAAWTRRGENGGETDNRAVIAETVKLRAERARLLGYPSYAHFRLEDTMAKTPDAAQGLLRAVWGPARALALAEQGQLQEMADRDAAEIRVGPHDWRFYAERVRKERYDFDAAALKPYLTLDRMIEAAFDCASRLFGLAFVERHDLPVYHPAVRTFEVRDAAGESIGLFLGDYYARPSKRSGAWMSAFRRQRKLDGVVRPIVVNVMNFAEGADGEPTLLSFDDARTLFHEFGHALHGLLSNVTYPSIAGTSVPRDWVEFPSQLFEHWLDESSVLQRFAHHCETDAPMPPELIERLRAARKFNQGFATVEYVSSALVDLDFHLLPSADNLDVDAFEATSLAAIAMPEGFTMRHRPPHFTHAFSGDGYASAYYSYMWSEVLDADGFAAFEETGDAFDPGTAKRLKDFVYSAGDLREPDEAYTLFRGRLPSPEALLRQRGLAPARRQGEM